MTKKHYRNLLFTLLSILLFHAAHAQTDSASSIKNQLIHSLCSCTSQQSAASITTIEQAIPVLNTCLTQPETSALFFQYANASGVDFLDIDKLKALVFTLAGELADHCPAMKTMAINIAKDSTQQKKLQEFKNELLK